MSTFSWQLVDTSAPVVTSGGAGGGGGVGSVGAGAATGSEVVRDIGLDPTTGDLQIVDGDLVLLSGADALRQDLERRLQFFMGEWFLDQTAGIPFYDEVLVKAPSPEVIRGIFEKEILSTEGVKDLADLELDYDASARSLTVSFTVGSDFGQFAAAISTG